MTDIGTALPHGMKAPYSQLQIVSWNLHEKNLHAKHALSYILSLNPHIICLQETPEFLLDEIRNNSKYDNIISVDFDSNGKISYLCILIRNNISANKTNIQAHSDQMKKWWGPRTLRYQWNMCLHSQSIEIKISDKPVRIINCHLDVTGPIKERHEMLRTISNLHINDTDDSVILCGDLNLFGCTLRNVVAGWFFGVLWSELFINEQDMLEKFLLEKDLTRTFPRDTITHYWSWFSNLDHVLFRGLRLQKKGMLPSMHKSDHRGLFAAFDINT